MGSLNIHGVIAASAMNRPARKIKDIDLIPKGIKRLKISSAIMMSAVEAMGNNGHRLHGATELKPA